MKETEFSLFALDALMELPTEKNEGIAVIGMAARIADMESIDELWQALCGGECHIRPFPEQRAAQMADYYSAWGKTPRFMPRAYFENIDTFDASFFRVSPKDAQRMDPAQRLFIQTAWHALEDGGYGAGRLSGSRTGVFVGYGGEAQSYARYMQTVNPEEEAKAMAGTVNSVIASRISYLLNLRGPAMLVDTACSSSLVAVHLACESLRRGECSMALAGGIKLILAPDFGAEGDVSVASSDGLTRTFDESSQGTGGGEGVGVVLLKPYEDALRDKDHIYAVIQGSAVNQDGQTVGITAPNTQAQQDMLLDAWDKAGLPLETAGYIEAHGTATRLGDSIEIDALTKAFRMYSQKRQFCAIGSAKTNVGHLDSAAGILGLIKAIKVTETGLIPPSLHFNSPNRQLDFVDSPLYVNDRLSSWTGRLPRRGGVSSFGMSGTNCHVVLEQVPERDEDWSEADHTCLLPLSAATEGALRRVIRQYVRYFETTKERLADICYTSNISRGDHKLRAVFCLRGKEDFRMLAQEALQGDSCTGCYGGETELAAAFIRGDAPDWEDAGRNARRVSLPLYPFEKTAYWVTPERKPVPAAKKRLSHPLLDLVLVNTRDCRVYESRMSVSRTMELREHCLGGRHTLAGTVYIELIRSAMLHQLPSGRMELSDLVFLAPLTCGEKEERVVQTVILKKDTGWQVSIQSAQAGREEWSPHVEVTVLPLDKVTEKIDLSRLKAEFEPYLQKDYVANSGDFIHIGPHWNLPLEVFAKGKRVLTHVWTPEAMRTVLAPYGVYPALLDGSIHGCNVLNDKGFCLPFCFGSIRLYGKTSTESYGLMEKVEGAEGLNTYNGTLFTQTGQVVAELRRYSMRHIDQSEEAIFGRSRENAFHRVAWDPTGLPGQERGQEDTLLLYHPRQDGHPLCARFPSVEISGEEDVIRLLAERGPVERLIFLHGQSHARGQENGEILYYLCRFLESHRAWKTELTVVTAGAYSVLPGETANPYAQLLSAMVQALPWECDRLTVSCVDAEDTMEPDDLFRALRRKYSHVTVAVREGTVYVPRLERLHPQKKRELTFSPEGVYVITGGLGGMGITIAKALAQRQPEIHLALLTRRKPTTAEWEQVPEQAEIALCDVTDRATLEECLDGLRKKHGRIAGVFHTAGVAGGGIYLRRNWEDFEKVFAPKVAGTQNLYELLKENPPEFMLLFSSYASVLYPAGQSDYIAANAFLDAFCTKAPWIQTVNWAGWKETGMGVRNGADQSKNAVDSLTNAEAMELLWQAMEAKEPRLLLGSWSKAYFDKNAYIPYYILPTGVSALEETNYDTPVQLTGKLSGEPTATELRVAQAWAKVLGLRELDYGAKFLEVGGDSISAAALQKELSGAYPGVLDITDVFVYPSIGEMAGYIDSSRKPSATTSQAGEHAAAYQDSTMDLLEKLSAGDIDLEEALSLIGG